MAAQTAEREIDGRQAGMAWQASPDLSVSISAGLPEREKLKLAASAISVFCQTKTDRKRAL